MIQQNNPETFDTLSSDIIESSSDTEKTFEDVPKHLNVKALKNHLKTKNDKHVFKREKNQDISKLSEDTLFS